MNQLAPKEQSAILRPPKVLVPLIQDDLKNGDEAAARASLPYYERAGEKLIEAKAQMPHGKFIPWAEKAFGRTQSQLNKYMQAARLKLGDTTTDRQIDRRQETLSHRVGDTRSRHDRPYPIQNTIDLARRDMERLQQEEITRKQERDAERQLAIRLIDIGYKVLAKELHPDSGGSREAMQRLSRIRDHLKASL